MSALPVTDQPGYASNFGVLAALTVGALAASVVWNHGWNAMSSIMPAVACLGPAGILLMHLRRSANVGMVMAVAMIVAFPIGIVTAMSQMSVAP